MDTAKHQSGVMRVNGEWVTSVVYEAPIYGPDTQTLTLRFLKGRDLVASVTLNQQDAARILGDANLARIRRAIATDADKYLPAVKGTLRGAGLEFRDVTVPSSGSRKDGNPEPPSRGSPEPGGGSLGADETVTRPAPQFQQVPAHIASKYLKLGDRYHFDDQAIAFIDQGSKLTAKTENRAVVQDLVAIASDRGWTDVRVRGTESFRQAVWREAIAAGLTVVGYSPSAAQVAASERDRPVSARERDTRPSEGRSTPLKSVDPSAQVVYGTLVTAGPAPYRHDSSKPASFQVTLRDASGTERTFWGAGLKDALQGARTAPQIGDEVGIRRTGEHPVAVVAPTVDENGEIRRLRTERARALWVIEKSSFFRRGDEKEATPISLDHTNRQGVPGTMDAKPEIASGTRLTRDQEAAAAIRSAQITREELQLKYPDINKAVFQHFSAQEQFAAAYVKAGLIRESDRQQVIAQMRERLAGKLERGELLRDPDDSRINTLIRRSINRVAADIGRPTVEVNPRSLDTPVKTPIREDAQVRM
jgi:hypothetical protein